MDDDCKKRLNARRARTSHSHKHLLNVLGWSLCGGDKTENQKEN